MTVDLQAKLLRVLQEKCFERLGGLESITVDTRVIAATNRNLKKLVGEGSFREDLYYRLNVFPVSIPPLRERKEAIPVLVEYLADRLSRKLGKHVKSISEDAMKRLVSYPWPGNIRELENTIEKAMILSKTSMLEIQLPAIEVKAEVENLNMKSVEKKAIEDALKRANGNRRSASEMLGISLRALQYKIKEYNINER